MNIPLICVRYSHQPEVGGVVGKNEEVKLF